MNRKINRFIISTLVGTIGYYLIGWLFFDFIIGSYTDLHSTQLVGFKKKEDQISLFLLIISCAAYAALISFILVFISDIKGLFQSFTIGSIIGVLIAIMTDTYWHATSYFYSNVTVIFLDILAAGVTVGFMSLLIFWVNSKLNRVLKNHIY